MVDLDKQIALLDKKIELLNQKNEKIKKEEKKKLLLKAPKYSKRESTPPKPIIDFRGFEVLPISWSWKFGIIPIPPSLNKNFKTLIVYFSRNRAIKFIGLNKDMDTVLEYLGKEDYIINNPKEFELFNYKGKSVLWVTPDSPINLQIDLKKELLLCDSKTFHNLVNNVVEYRLTKASGGLGNFGDIISKYWWVGLIGLGFYLASQSPEGLKGFFGL